MKFAFGFLSFLMLLASPQLLAATAPLKSQEVQGMRKTCAYEAEGQVKTVSVSFNLECPAEVEIDRFVFSRTSWFGKQQKSGAPSLSAAGEGVHSGEMSNGTSKSCAYRHVHGETRYRTVPADQPCPMGY